VWYDGRPAGQQPPPTSCSSARRDAARNGGRVIYGGDEDRDDRYDSRRDRDRDRNRDRDDIYDRDNDDDDDRIYRDNRHPDDRDYPRTMPETVWGVIHGRNNVAARGVRSWLGTSNARARITDSNRDGRPEIVTWYDSRGAIIQRWIDDNRDGRVDRVGLYRNGRVARIIR
jgi:hypothetical protein